MKGAVVDTNVPLVAAGRADHAGDDCRRASIRAVKRVMTDRTKLVLDDGFEIIKEYCNKLSQSGQPTIGDAFLKWVLTNRMNRGRCEQVSITPIIDESRSYLEFPEDPRLAGFDRSDRKFVAVARASALHPAILNAVDSDWWDYYELLTELGVEIEFICDDQVVQWNQVRR